MYSNADLLKIYESGKGSIRVRARYEVEKLARGQWRVAVYELPPSVSAQKILSSIEELTNPKPKAGKKQLTQDQQNTKSLMLSLLDRVRDESDAQSPVRLIFEPKSSRIDPDEFMNTLMAQTDLECNVSVNLVMMGRNGRPAQKGLKSILAEWLDFRTQTVTRRLQHRLGQVERRIHILQGRMTVYLHIDEVIHVIRHADEPKPELMAKFSLTDIQAEDILEIRLRQLQEEQQELNHLLGDELAKKRLIIQEINQDVKTYGDARRTLIESAERATLVQTTADEPITIILSCRGWIRSRAGHHLDLSQTTFKDGDDLLQVIETRTVNPIAILDSQGRSYTIDASEIPGGRGDGVPLASLIDIQNNASIVAILSGQPEQRYLLAGTGGYGFICSFENMVIRQKAGKVLMTIENGEKVLPPIALSEQDRQPESSVYVLLATSEPRILAFLLNEVKELSKGRGLQLVSMADGVYLEHIIITQSKEYIVESVGRRGAVYQDTLPLETVINKRARKGKPMGLSGSLKALLLPQASHLPTPENLSKPNTD